MKEQIQADYMAITTFYRGWLKDLADKYGITENEALDLIDL